MPPKLAGFVIRSSVRELPNLNQNLADMTTPQELSLTLTELPILLFYSQIFVYLCLS